MKYVYLLAILYLLLIKGDFYQGFKYVNSKRSPEPLEYMLAQRSYPYASVPSETYYESIELMKKMNAFRELNNIVWESVGPDNIGGRITDLAMHASDQQTIYAATASGGVWKSSNQGENWSPITDKLPTLAIGDIAISPSNKNTIWCGTGEPNGGGGSVAYDGRGIFKSMDAGSNWIYSGLTDCGSVGRIIVNPKNDNVVYIAAMGTLFANNSERGVFKTHDGGLTWQKILFINDSTGAVDLAIHPNSPDTIFAVTWERVRRQNMRRYGGQGCGIWRSFNGGKNWTALRTGLPSSNNGRIGIALSEKNPSILYAIYADQTGYFKGVYKTNDLGNSWSAISNGDPDYSSFGWWFGQIYISPHNSEEVYTMGVDWSKTNDGGLSWLDVSEYLHADYHSLYIHPKNSNLHVVGNDGGIFISKAGGTRNSWRHRPIPITQLYTSEIDFQQANVFAAGAQDNGTWIKNGSSNSNWQNIYGGDGFTVLIDPKDSNRKYFEYQYGNFSSTEGAKAPPGARFNWNTPFIIDPFVNTTLYMGAESVFKSTDRGFNWVKISQDLTDGPKGSGGVVYGTLTSLAASTKDKNTLLVGCDDGNVWITKNAGTHWTKISSSLPKRWVTRVVTDLFESNTIYVCFSGFRHNENIAHIYKSMNNGVSWLDISGDLPDIPVNDLIQDPLNASHFYIATDIGIFQTQNNGNNWIPVNNGMPIIPVTDLTFHSPTRIMVASTYGRSMFKTRLSIPTQVETLSELEENSIRFNQTSELLIVQLSLQKKQNIAIELIDQSGRVIYQKMRNNFDDGFNQFEINTSSFLPGVYYCNLKGEKNMITKKVVKL